jgi:hypothetical protein
MMPSLLLKKKCPSWIMTVLAWILLGTLRQNSSVAMVVAASKAAEAYVGGTPHSKVIDLDDVSFPEAMKDPSNPLWFLKFYAPWCGHW